MKSKKIDSGYMSSKVYFYAILHNMNMYICIYVLSLNDRSLAYQRRSLDIKISLAWYVYNGSI